MRSRESFRFYVCLLVQYSLSSGAYLLHFAELSTRTISLSILQLRITFTLTLYMFVWVGVQVAVTKFLQTTLQLAYPLFFLYLGMIPGSDIAKFIIICFGLHTCLLCNAHLLCNAQLFSVLKHTTRFCEKLCMHARSLSQRHNCLLYWYIAKLISN